ncbi:MAG TPA: VOC family protein [Frankiaceae bacterium]|nr:VOC family protein [Frankiaceae bacterium]
MPERASYTPGEFAWADLTTTDVPAAATFYGTLFGWQAEELTEPGAGGYTMLTLDGRQVAAVAPKMGEDPGPSRWSVYVASDDLEKTLELVTASGGTPLMPPLDIFDAGRMAMAADPAGAVIALWQAGTHHGAQLVDEPGALTWVELATTDVAGAKAFYQAVFGWGLDEAGGGDYTEFTFGGKSVAGMMPKSPDMPADLPPYWMPYFQSDPDRLAGEITALGGTLLVPPADVPGAGGRFTVATDPQGAVFGIYHP